jgi:hypothetical protein
VSSIIIGREIPRVQGTIVGSKGLLSETKQPNQLEAHPAVWQSEHAAARDAATYRLYEIIVNINSHKGSSPCCIHRHPFHWHIVSRSL